MNASHLRTLLPPAPKPGLAPSRGPLEAGEVTITSKLRYMDSDGSMAPSHGGGRTNPTQRVEYFFKTGKICQLSNKFFGVCAILDGSFGAFKT